MLKQEALNNLKSNVEVLEKNHILGWTTVTLKHLPSGKISGGAAKRGYNDRYSENTGYGIAYGRALKAMRVKLLNEQIKKQNKALKESKPLISLREWYYC